MITEIKKRRITCDRCNSSYEYEVNDLKKISPDNFFVSITSSTNTWDLCKPCYNSFINWLALLDDTKSKDFMIQPPKKLKLRGSDNG